MLTEFFNNNILPFLKSFSVFDVLDIVLVAFIAYHVIKFVKQTRAAQLIKGIVILLVVMYASDWLHLNVINFILINTMQVGVIALLIVFQPELRRALEHMGRSKFGKIFNFDARHDYRELVEETCLAASALSRSRTGALIVFERDTKLDDLLTGGTVIRAELTSELLENIFVPNTPLHDGAVLVRDGRIEKAATVLPLAESKTISRELGTRHRAALGISELSDCVVLVVSEETGKVSIALNGDMIRNLSPDSLRQLLRKLVDTPEKESRAAVLKFWKGRGK